MAAYFDPQYAGGKWELPGRAGNGVAYTAQITEGTVILPVAVDIQGEPFAMGKPDLGRLIGKADIRKMKGEQKKVTVNMGKPIVLEDIPDIEMIEYVIGKREKGENVTVEEREKFKLVTRAIKAQSAEVMNAIASLLPEEKRGPWGPHEDTNSDISEQ